MAFTIPTFNLVCNVWRGIGHSGAPDIVNLACNLQFGRKPHILDLQENVGINAQGQAMFLLVPAGSDLRDGMTTSGFRDTVEVPSGTGRFYVVWAVDDVGKGFSNEYRVATISKSTSPVFAWPEPIP
jgi:hypothetical protein